MFFIVRRLEFILFIFALSVKDVVLDVSGVLKETSKLTEIDSVTMPLKNQTDNPHSLPRLKWDDLSIKEEEYLKKVQNNVLLVKSEEYWLILSDLENAMNNYEVDQDTLIEISKEILNSSEEFEIYNKDNKVQSLLGGNGIIEFNKLKENIRYGVELLLNEIRENKRCIDNFKMVFDLHLKTPVLSISEKIRAIINENELPVSKSLINKGYAYSFQLLNTIKERYKMVKSITSVIDKNHFIIEDMLNTWNYIMNEFVMLLNNLLKPIIAMNSEDKVSTSTKSGNDLIKKAELINSMFSNTIFIKYGKIDQLTQKEKNNESEGENKSRESEGYYFKLLNSFELKPIDLDFNRETSDEAITWETDVSLSIRNVLQGTGLSELFKDIDDYIKNVDLIDLKDVISNQMNEIDNKLYELSSMESEIKTTWLIFNYLKKDESLLKSNDNLKYFVENEELNIDNQERITYIYNQLVNGRSEYQIIHSSIVDYDYDNKNIDSFNGALNTEQYLGLKTIMCLNELYQRGKDTYNFQSYLHYSDSNSNCIHFFVEKINLYRNKGIESGTNKESNVKSEHIIEYFVSLLFSNKEENHFNNYSNSPIQSLILELKEEETQKHENNEEYQRILAKKRDRANKIMEKINEYNENSKFVLNKANEAFGDKNIITEKYEQVKEYVGKTSKVIRDHITNTISSKEDIINVFENLEKVLKLILEEFSEKSIYNENTIISLKSKYDHVKFLFNDYIAKYNLEFNRKERINNSGFFTNIKHKLEEFVAKMEVIAKQVEEINSGTNQNDIQNNISLLLVYIHSSITLILGSESYINHEHDENDNSKIMAVNLRYENSYLESFRSRYAYILRSISYYDKMHQELKRKKESLLDNENVLINNLKLIKSQIERRMSRGDEDIKEKLSKQTLNKVRKQRKIAEKLLTGYLTLYLNIYNPKSNIIKNTFVALDNAISDYKYQINKFKKENSMEKEATFLTKFKHFFNLKKFYKVRKYYKVMKSFDDYIIQKRNQFLEYLNYSDKTIDILNKRTLKIVDFYLCKGKANDEIYDSTNDQDKGISFNNQVVGLNKLVNKMEPIQILIGDLYDIFNKLGKVEKYGTINYIESISKMLFNAVREYENLNKNIIRIQKKALGLYLKQQAVIESIIELIKIILPATYIIKNYNKIPKEYLNYKHKFGSNDILDKNKNRHINIKGWDINKGKSKIHLENFLTIQRKYIRNDEEFDKMNSEIDKQIKGIIPPPVDSYINKYTGNIAIFLISDELLEQIVFELERNELTFFNEQFKREDRNKKITVMGYCIEQISKKREQLYKKLISKSLIVKQGKCSDNNI